MANIKNYNNIKYRNGGIVSFKKMAECTYYVVPNTPDNYYTDYSIFTDEDAAYMFANNIGSVVELDWHYVTID